MKLKDLQRNWDEFGRIDPLWAIITHPDKKGQKWQIDEFFEFGKKEIEEVMDRIGQLGISYQRKKALDFGCGVGRLTQALAEYFDEVCGVDIAPSMIELAKKYNRYGNKCSYFLNESDNLSLFNERQFDFIYTNITLQHIRPQHSKNYIKEFLRILDRNGLLIFQVPSEASSQLNIIDRIRLFLTELDFYRRLRYGTKAKMEMWGIKRDEVISLLEKNGGEILDIRKDDSAGKAWTSYQYVVRKK